MGWYIDLRVKLEAQRSNVGALVNTIIIFSIFWKEIISFIIG